MNEAAAAERFEEAAQLRDAARTVQTLRDRQQKMATVRLGDRDVFGLQMGPAGAVVQVFVMRERRVLERVELAANEGISGTAAEILQASVEQFYEDRPAPAEVHLSSRARRCASCSRPGCRRAPAAACRCSCRKRGEKRGLVDLAVRNARLAYQARLDRHRPVAVRRARDAALDAGLAGHSAPHRVLRHLDDSGQRNRGVDGRLRRRPDAEGRVSQVPHLSGESRRIGRLRRDARGRDAAISEAARAGRAVSRSHPDRRRQGAAVGGLRRARGSSGSRIWSRSASRRRKSCSTRATAKSRSRLPKTIRRCCCSSRFATKRTGSR